MCASQLAENTLIFRFNQQSRYSVAALLGAVELDSRLHGLQVDVPARITKRTIERRLSSGRVIIAYSVMSTQLDSVRRESRQIRRDFGDRVIMVAGGAHATARPRDLLSSGFDYVVVGEGEYAFPEMISLLLEGKRPDSIPGVVTQNTETIPTPKTLSRIELDCYPPFALGMNIVGPIEVTRGCPFRCKFCATPFLTGGVVRHRTVESIVKWLTMAVQKRGFRRTWFLSPNALCYGGNGRRPNLERLETLLRETTAIEGIDEVFFGAFPSEVRAEFVTADALRMMRHYVANKSLQIGLQSGSNRVLKAINRHHTVEQGLDAARTAMECGFVPHVDMIFGLPGESPEDLRASIETCHLLTEMGALIHGHMFMPLPGSDFEAVPPSRLGSEAKRELGELSRKGLMTGSWVHQESLGESLARKQPEL